MCRSPGDGRVPILTLLAALVIPLSPRVEAQDAPGAQQETQAVYLLDVSVNGFPLGLVARFVEQGRRLRLPAEQFDGLGFASAPANEIAGERWIWLDQLPGFSWSIDQARQAIDIRAPVAAIKATTLRVAPGPARIDAKADWGAVLSWDAFGQWSMRADDPLFSRSWSVGLDTRVFSPRFTAVSHATVFGAAASATRVVRLDSYADLVDVRKSRRLRIGDTYSGGPSWMRPIRFGGLQWSRDFALRPDIVTTPAPMLDQEIAAPSTVDLFVNGVQRYANAVTPGPLHLRDLPVVTGGNTIRAVITDRSGKRTEVTMPFYVASQLLTKDTTDFNLELGFPRRRYAIASNDYGALFASGAFRRGLSDRVTLSGYAAASRRYRTAGLGAATTLGAVASVEAAVLGSHVPTGDGWAFVVNASHTTPRFNVAGGYLRGFSYIDLADFSGYAPLAERATASIGLNLGRAGQVNAAYARTRPEGRRSTDVVSATYALGLGDRRQVNVVATSFADLSNQGWGVSLALSFPLGGRAQAYAQQGWRDGKPNTQAQLKGRGEHDAHPLDWQAGATWERGGGYALDAYGGWRGPRADLAGRISRVNDSTGLEGELSQSLVLMGGRAFLAGPINDGFAVVELPGSPGVRVALENRTVGRTDGSGHLLVTGLQPNVGNSISIAVLDLPIDADIETPSRLVAPLAGAGVLTRFEVRRERSAVVVLQLPGGENPPAGATVRLAGSDFAEPLGFGGEIYVRGLKTGQNRLDVTWRESNCSASFDATVKDGALPRLGPYPCVR